MKYFRVVAYTMYCGETLTDYIATDDETELQEFATELMGECAFEWEPRWSDFADYGYESAEEWQEDYFASTSATIQEITKEEYDIETRPVRPIGSTEREIYTTLTMED